MPIYFRKASRQRRCPGTSYWVQANVLKFNNYTDPTLHSKDPSFNLPLVLSSSSTLQAPQYCILSTFWQSLEDLAHLGQVPKWKLAAAGTNSVAKCSFHSVQRKALLCVNRNIPLLQTGDRMERLELNGRQRYCAKSCGLLII